MCGSTGKYMSFPLAHTQCPQTRGQWGLLVEHWLMVPVDFIEKFLPLPGFEPGTSPVPSGHANN